MSWSIGKTLRMRRLLDAASGSSVICALDHGLTSPSFLTELSDLKRLAADVTGAGVNVLMLSRGGAADVASELPPHAALALMLTASAAGRPSGMCITPIGSVDEALRLAADAVVVYVSLAGQDEAEVIRYVSAIGEECLSSGMPMIAEAEFPDAYGSPDAMTETYGSDYLFRNARLCAELGADIIKVNWPGSAESFEQLVLACNRPIVLAGGSRLSDHELLQRMYAARNSGAVGCSVGRNIFQHARPALMTRALVRIFRDKWSAREAIQELEAAMNMAHVSSAESPS